MSNVPTNPQDDADRIRMKRLAKLQSSAPSSGTSSPVPEAASAPTTPKPKPPAPKPSLSPAPKRSAEPAPTSSTVPPKKKASPLPAKLDFPAWEHQTLGQVFNVTLDKATAEQSGWEVVWLKHLAADILSDDSTLPQPLRMDADLSDRLLISRLEIDPASMSDDMEYLSVIASLPAQQTVFEYLVGCWKRLNSAKSSALKKGYSPPETQQALELLDKLRNLIVSYAGLTLQEPEMFPQPSGRPLGAPELVSPLISLSALSAPLLSSNTSQTLLSPTDVEPFLQDLARRFDTPDELADVLGPVVRGLLLTHESLARPEGIAGADASWRGVLAGLEALVSVKPIAIMITTLPEWNPKGATAATFERVSLLGPLLRLGVFGREWPFVGQTYFQEPEKKSRVEVESFFASLRGTLKTLQSTLFQVFNSIVRSSPDAREAVLQYFARIIALNPKRTGMQVDWTTVSSDSFMINVQNILFRFAEPFMDAQYTKIDRIDPLYVARSSRIDLSDVTRIKATRDESVEWNKQNASSDAPAPNFISDIYWLNAAMFHCGYLPTLSAQDELAKHYDEMKTYLDTLQGDGSWMGGPLQARTEAAINQVKTEQSKLHSLMLTYQVQLEDPEFMFRSLGLVNFVATWLIRFVDPRHQYPGTMIDLPLPKDVPLAFRVLPEYMIEDVITYMVFLSQHAPSTIELSGKTEVVIFCLTFLTSTWYIQNPFLKAKLVEVLFYGVLPMGPERKAALVNTLNSHPMALKHLMAALTHFYIEVEQTGATSQFYDKFNSRRSIAYILKVIWNNPEHRQALKSEAENVDKFVRFVNLMINDVTYLMDESLSDLAKIHAIQQEMADATAWAARSPQYRKEKEGELRQLDRVATSYCTLGKGTVELLKVFTAETKAPFMMPEIVDRLAAMLDYNLDALVGPKCQDLQVKNPEKYRFSPRDLLSDIVQVFLNLGDQGEFVRAVANDGRSYRKELFERAAGIARKRGLKSEEEIEHLRLFVVKVEEMRATLEAEEDMGEIPEEFLDPLMATLMRDPVILPSSRTVIDRSTIKTYLLSDTTDPFNRQPLSIEDVIPDVGLKQRIDAFLSERRNKHTALDVPAESLVNMDGVVEDDGPNMDVSSG